MNSIQKILSLFLVLTMLLSLLVGCGSALPPNEDAPPEETPSLQETDVPSHSLNLSGYTLIRPTDCCDALTIAASQFQLTLNEVTGASVRSEEDFLLDEAEPDTTSKEILLGLTNRPESKAVLEELNGAFSFSIQVRGNKIVILGATAELTIKAMDFLTEQYLPRSTGDKTLTVPLSYVSHSQSYQEVITDGRLNYKLIYKAADNLNSNRIVVNELSEVLEQMTGSTVDPIKDEIAADPEPDLNKKAIVVGVTTYPRSSELLESTGLFGWALSAEGNQIYVSASLIVDAISSNRSTLCFLTSIDKSVLYNLSAVVPFLRLYGKM